MKFTSFGKTKEQRCTYFSWASDKLPTSKAQCNLFSVAFTHNKEPGQPRRVLHDVCEWIRSGSLAREVPLATVTDIGPLVNDSSKQLVILHSQSPFTCVHYWIRLYVWYFRSEGGENKRVSRTRAVGLISNDKIIKLQISVWTELEPFRCSPLEPFRYGTSLNLKMTCFSKVVHLFQKYCRTRKSFWQKNSATFTSPKRISIQYKNVSVTRYIA